MPDARRARPVRPRRTALRAAAATILAVPVIGLVIADSVARRVGRPAILVVLLLTSTAAVSAFSTPLAASPASTPTPISADQFHSVAVSEPTERPTQRPLVAILPPPTPPEPRPTATPTPEAPTVIRFRPRDDWTGMSRFADVSVRFSQPMDHASTERAFHITVDKKRISERSAGPRATPSSSSIRPVPCPIARASRWQSIAVPAPRTAPRSRRRVL